MLIGTKILQYLALGTVSFICTNLGLHYKLGSAAKARISQLFADSGHLQHFCGVVNETLKQDLRSQKLIHKLVGHNANCTWTELAN